MANAKVASKGGQGGRLGHANMEHSTYTEEVKQAARKRRRAEARGAILEELERSPAIPSTVTVGGDMVPKPLVTRSEKVMGGAVVFAGTRVPIQTLLDYLEEGDTLDHFLDDFPTVSREHAIAVLELRPQGSRNV